MIELKHVSHRYRHRRSLVDISCEFGSGLWGLLGPNGAGKSTLLSILATLREQLRMHALADRVNEARAGDFVISPGGLGRVSLELRIDYIQSHRDNLPPSFEVVGQKYQHQAPRASVS